MWTKKQGSQFSVQVFKSGDHPFEQIHLVSELFYFPEFAMKTIWLSWEGKKEGFGKTAMKLQ